MMTVVPILKAPLSILVLQPLHVARLLFAYSTVPADDPRENGDQQGPHKPCDALMVHVRMGVRACVVDEQGSHRDMWRSSMASGEFVIFLRLAEGGLRTLPLVLPPGSTVIARPPSTGSALPSTLLCCATGGGVVARLAPLLGKLERRHELLLAQLAVGVGIGGVPHLAQLGGVQAAAPKHREDLLLAEPAARAA